ncbi:hypothetical protein [Nocardia sp. BMG111209]|uniref:hypothetical protein n=1 Tax=Nocardia sp. BMG111209 TaxID=1160137 RepID=UPI0003A94CE4|nr:hypothetical protein [Nocardia sp. BMG111209]
MRTFVTIVAAFALLTIGTAAAVFLATHADAQVPGTPAGTSITTFGHVGPDAVPPYRFSVSNMVGTTADRSSTPVR